MTSVRPSSVQGPAASVRWLSDRTTLAIVVVGTIAAWGHTIDEIRIGELSAIPASVFNLGLIAGWQRLGPRSRGWLTLLFGLFWTITVIPYHVVPLIQGFTTWQNVSGLLRVAGGMAMAIAGIQMLRGTHDDRATSSDSA